MTAHPPASKLTGVQWLILAIAALGFAFDIYEILMAQFIVRPALEELAGVSPGSKDPAVVAEFRKLATLFLYVPAIAGGVFGLLGGYLTDLWGRRRVLTGSILLYAFSAFAAGFSTNFAMLLFFRSTTFIGVCVEFVAAVAWLAELFDDPHRREKALGYTQAFSSFGGLLVAIAFGLSTTYDGDWWGVSLPGWLNVFGGEIKNPNAPWRYTLMSGLIPALPLIVIRPFLPESPKWKEKKDAGLLKRPSIAQLFQGDLRKTTIVTTILFACSYGAAFGAIQQVQQIAPRLSDVKQAVNAAKEKGAKVPEQKAIEQGKGANYGKVQEVGGLLGRFALALLALRFASRRNLLRVFVLPGIILMPLIFVGFAVLDPNPVLVSLGGFDFTILHLGIFLAGLLTVAQFSFWGNYLPAAYPLHLRGTGESFAANIGGRIFGTAFFGVTQYLAGLLTFGTGNESKLAFASAIVGGGVFIVAAVLSGWLPEPKPESMAD
jgi:MFS family permease